MVEIVVWLALLNNSRGLETVKERFVSENACKAFVAEMERKANQKPSMYNTAGICIEARVAK